MDGTIEPMRSEIAFLHSPDYECDIGVHVFPMRKFGMLRDQLVAEGHVRLEDILTPKPASQDDLLLVHTPEYLDDLKSARWTPRTMMSELPLDPAIIRGYVASAGGTTEAARLALEGGFGVNLGGGFHHAFADRAEGFCYINDLAVAIRVLQRDRLLRRAAVVDADVHQGNGTAGIFEGDESVFTFSIHQERNYPEPKARSDLDIGLENGTGDDAYNERLSSGLERVWRFEPEIVALPSWSRSVSRTTCWAVWR